MPSSNGYSQPLDLPFEKKFPEKLELPLNVKASDLGTLNQNININSDSNIDFNLQRLSKTPNYSKSDTRNLLREMGINPYMLSGSLRKQLRETLNTPLGLSGFLDHIKNIYGEFDKLNEQLKTQILSTYLDNPSAVINTSIQKTGGVPQYQDKLQTVGVEFIPALQPKLNKSLDDLEFELDSKLPNISTIGDLVIANYNQSYNKSYNNPIKSSYNPQFVFDTDAIVNNSKNNVALVTSDINYNLGMTPTFDPIILDTKSTYNPLKLSDLKPGPIGQKILLISNNINLERELKQRELDNVGYKKSNNKNIVSGFTLFIINGMGSPYQAKNAVKRSDGTYQFTKDGKIFFGNGRYYDKASKKMGDWRIDSRLQTYKLLN